jgi:hypothetical protein
MFASWFRLGFTAKDARNLDFFYAAQSIRSVGARKSTMAVKEGELVDFWRPSKTFLKHAIAKAFSNRVGSSLSSVRCRTVGSCFRSIVTYAPKYWQLIGGSMSQLPVLATSRKTTEV